MHRQIIGFFLGHLANPDRGQRQVFQHSHMREKVEMLEHHTDIATDGFDVFNIITQQDVIHGDFALLINFKTVQRADQR